MYDNTVYFELKKELPGCLIGSQVTILSDELSVNGIKLPKDFALLYPEWFNPITHEKHCVQCAENGVKFIMDKYSKTRSEAIKILKSIK